MQFSIYINQVKAIEWGLNLQQSALFAFLYELPSWAEEVIIGGKSYRWISKSKIINELPILTTKPDTIKNHLKALEDLNLIERKVVNKVKLCIRITEKGRLWNRDSALEVVKKIPRGSEKNPYLGSEKNPPNHITNNQITNINNKNLDKKDSELEIPNYFDLELWEEYLKNRKSMKVKNTPRALKTLINKIQKIEDIKQGAGMEALEEANSRGWKSVVDPFEQKPFMNSKGFKQQSDACEPRKIRKL